RGGHRGDEHKLRNAIRGRGSNTFDDQAVAEPNENHLVVVAEETAEGATRYQMLETLGQYARERLDEHGDVDGWRRRHAEYFAGWAEEAGPGLVGPDELAWRPREDAELDNLRTAVTWALDRDDPDAG